MFTPHLFFNRFSLSLLCLETIIIKDVVTKENSKDIFIICTPLLFRNIIEEHFSRGHITYLYDMSEKLHNFLDLHPTLKSYCTFTLKWSNIKNAYPEIESLCVGKIRLSDVRQVIDSIPNLRELDLSDYEESENIEELISPNLQNLEVLDISNVKISTQTFGKNSILKNNL